MSPKHRHCTNTAKLTKNLASDFGEKKTMPSKRKREDDDDWTPKKRHKRKPKGKKKGLRPPSAEDKCKGLTPEQKDIMETLQAAVT